MPSIPSVGINSGNITDPNVVNIETQAYPPPVDLAQSLTRNLAALIAGSAYAPPPVPPGNQAGPLFRPTAISDQVFILPSLALGTPLADIPDVDVGQQLITRQPAAEIIVTESGNYQFNAPVPTSVRLTISTVTTFAQVDNGGVTITFYVITFVAGVNLMDYGVELTGTEALFPNSAPAGDPNDFPGAAITKFTNRQIVVDGSDLTIAPVTGNVVDIDVTRHGDEVVFDIFTPDVNVTIDAVQSASAAVTTVADARSIVDVFATDGVVLPFIGTGARIPLLLYLDLRETAFFPADQPIKTLGLPLNVNVG